MGRQEHCCISLSITGVLAKAMALYSPAGARPYPSKIIKAIGFFIALSVTPPAQAGENPFLKF
jgi:hypothetical protein